MAVGDKTKAGGLSHHSDHHAEHNVAAAAAVTTTTSVPSGPQEMTLGVPSDPDVSQQWYLTGTWGIHANLVWPDYTGQGIKLADLDDGFEYTHPDLSANYSTSLSYDTINNSFDGAAAQTGDDHGTAVMGVMIADDNGIGTVGVDFDGTGIGIRMGFGPNDGLSEILTGFQYALSVHASVLNDSWGFTDPFSDDFGNLSAGFTQIAQALKNLADQGRGGLGTPVTFAAGNSGDTGDNTNYHNFTNSIYTITVGAIDSSGTHAYFSTPGTSILVSAGGVSDLTTDRVGTAGYGSGNYLADDGTSFATPTVSGVIGLMLQANPNLGWRDVQQILAYSAQHNDPTSSSWQYNGAVNWNGGGLHFSDLYGFGAADAFTAVRLAETWTTQDTSANMTTVTTSTVSPNAVIPDMGSTTSTMTVTQNINIEHVQVHVNLTHSWVGDLVITLVAPDGTKSVLVDNPGTNQAGDFGGSGGINFTFETNADMGESSAGAWTLQVADNQPQDSGVLKSWNMVFTGSTPTVNNTYIYTNDFAGFSGTALAQRSTIDDTNGGTDTLNLAAVTTNSVVNLASGAGTIAGHAVTISGIENVYGGDGNDNFTAGSANSDLYGMRGNDTLTAGTGNDIFDGGQGTDTVVYADSVSDYSFTVVSATEVDVAHTTGAAFTDDDKNVEDFNFGGATYTMAQIDALATGGTVTPSPSPAPSPTPTPAPSPSPTPSPTPTGENLNGTSANDTLTGGSGDDTLHGLGGSDKLFGGSGNDILDGGTQADSMTGGSGNDTYYVDNSGDHVIEGLNGGTDTVHSTIGYLLPANVENLFIDGTAAVNGTGNGLNNAITGNTSHNVLQGGAGNDTLDGGGGNDQLWGNTGADTFHFGAATAFTGITNVEDFQAAQGDKLDLRDVLANYDPLTEALSNFVELTRVAHGTALLVDTAGTGAHFVQIAVLNNLVNVDENQLVATGNLLV